MSSEQPIKGQLLHTVWCNISGKASTRGTVWKWVLLGRNGRVNITMRILWRSTFSPLNSRTTRRASRKLPTTSRHPDNCDLPNSYRHYVHAKANLRAWIDRFVRGLTLCLDRLCVRLMNPVDKRNHAGLQPENMRNKKAWCRAYAGSTGMPNFDRTINGFEHCSYGRFTCVLLSAQE